MSQSEEKREGGAGDLSPTLLAFGNSAEGQLGRGQRENISAPEAVSSLKGVRPSFVACGERVSAVVTEGGAVLSTGTRAAARRRKDSSS